MGIVVYKETAMQNRRDFLRQTSTGAAAVSAFAGITGNISAPADPYNPSKRLPREVWIATITQDGLEAESHDEMIGHVLDRMKEFEAYRPDIVCLPETFPFTHLRKRPPLEEIAESPPGPITGKFADYAKKHNCYVICPTYTVENNRLYNASILFDRKGGVSGEYRKIHPTKGEIESGIIPGQLDPPVFDTDFGKIGMQICFDIEWIDAWQRLGKKGVEIVFWSSAFAGGSMVNSRAWDNKFHVVTSVNKDTAKICGMAGNEISRTSRWNRWTCAPVNLEVAFLHTWPFIRRFGEIHAKYGSKIRITNYGEEEWSLIESRSPDIRVDDILEEFEMDTIDEHLLEAERAQDKARL